MISVLYSGSRLEKRAPNLPGTIQSQSPTKDSYKAATLNPKP